MNSIFQLIHKRTYYISILFIISILVLGLLVDNPRHADIDVIFFIHTLFVIFISVGLIMYPRFEKPWFRNLLITVMFAFFYLLFFIYPDATTTPVLISFIPAISILFFDSKLFYITLIANTVLVSLFFMYIIFIDQGTHFPYLTMHIAGNLINIFLCQTLLFIIFKMHQARIRNLQSYYAEVQQSERLRTTGELAAGVAHEIRNPLTVVKGYLQLHRYDQSLTPAVKRSYTLMIDELNSAEHVISDFLTIAKSSKEQMPETVDVKRELKNITDLLLSYGHLHDNDINLQAEEGCYIAANSVEFKQLIINLVKNAIEASETGASIDVRAVKKKGNVEIDIADYGCGMSEEEMKVLGTPFYTLKSQGTGLGLMICYNIVDKYNGNLDFQSENGQGTTVHIRFPLEI
ncbi:sensor histidine kinase [Texcoconibacillus texcoconensis]|uniref:histidine kinase n=1 Tax=Texcoconibacillus texcoconensis TaxID=1095777 RepID=A0A840QR39_9BACI|nr:HAMP domain-containing sensor histidine kinase [Texcoconibacillus texcoconensis]MBB5173820.1 two-component system sporulation sensor kinase B [Texcoconibacillus texcoconensis]